MIAQLRRWLPHRTLVIVADSSYAVLDLLHFCQSMTRPVTFITRLRLDAALYEPAPPRLPGQMGRPRLKGQRLPTLKQLLFQPATPWTAVMVPWYDGTLRRVENASHTAVWYHKGKAPVPIRWVLIRDPMGAFRPQALLCTDLNVEPTRIIEWFRVCDGSWRSPRIQYGAGSSRKFALTWEWKTQRQWSDLAIARTTPALFGLFSWVTLAAHALGRGQAVPVRSAAWYHKALPTFSDAIALVRHHLWFRLRRFRHIPCSTQHPKNSLPPYLTAS